MEPDEGIYTRILRKDIWSDRVTDAILYGKLPNSPSDKIAVT